MARRGMAMSFERQPSAKERLKLQWDFPVHEPPAQKVTAGTVAAHVRRALDRDAAFAAARGDDQRPLLVLRECGTCKGTDDALLDRRMSNEQTMLMARWFHCVKLPDSVLEADHPFHALFAGEDPPHLFLANRDGSGVVALTGEQTQTELWKAMLGVLRSNYERDPEGALRERARLLNAFDTIDARRRELEQRASQELEKRGPKSPKLKTIQRDLDELAEQRRELEAREQKVMDLGLVAAAAEVGAADGAEAGGR